MDVIITLFKTQWMYLLAAAAIVALTFVLKKKAPQIYKKYCIAALVVTAVVLVVLAVFFSQPDLFLLVPIFMLCCELFGYEISGKIIGVFAVDYLLICLLNLAIQNKIINDVFNTILFIVLQILTAIAAGLLMDNHLRKLKAQKEKLVEEKKKEEIKEDKELEQHVDDLFDKLSEDDFLAKYSDESSDSSDTPPHSEN